MSDQNLIFTDGLGFDKPGEKAPKTIKLKMSVRVERFVKFLQENVKPSGFVNVDIRYSEEKGKYYATLNTYNSDLSAKDRQEIAEVKKANGLEPEPSPMVDEDINPDDIPF